MQVRAGRDGRRDNIGRGGMPDRVQKPRIHRPRVRGRLCGEACGNAMDERNTRKSGRACTDHEIGMGAGVRGSAAVSVSSSSCGLRATNDGENGEGENTDEKRRAAGLEGGGEGVQLGLHEEGHGLRKGLGFAEASSRSTTGSSAGRFKLRMLRHKPHLALILS